MLGQIKCGKCGGSAFQGDNLQLAISQNIVYAVYCAGCGAIAGVLDTAQPGKQLTQVKDAIADLRSTLQTVAHDVHNIKTTTGA